MSNPIIYAVASGKGGVGKSNVAVNLAYQMSHMGRKVLLFDADYGLGNTDILCGVAASKTLVDVAGGKAAIEEIGIKLAPNLTLLPAGSSDFDFANENPLHLEGLLLDMERYSHQFDVVLIDTGAGIGERVLSSLMYADEILIVTTGEPTALTDSYATIKMAAQQGLQKPVKVLVNMAENKHHGLQVFNHLNKISKKYLNLELKNAGVIPYDPSLIKAIRHQKPVTICFPKTKSSIAFKTLAHGFSHGVRGTREQRAEQRGKQTETNKLTNFIRQFFNEPNRILKHSAVAAAP